MKISKKIIAVIMSILIFSTVTLTTYEEAKAMTPVGAMVSIAGAVATAWEIKNIHETAYDSYHNGTWNDIQKWCKKNWGPVGYLVSMNTEAEFFDNVLKPALVSKGILSSEDTADETSYDKLKEYVDQHYEVNQDNSVNYDNDIKNLFIDCMNNYSNTAGYYYGYTYSIQEHLNDFSSGDLYNSIRQKINDNNDLTFLWTNGNKMWNPDMSNRCFVQKASPASNGSVKVIPYNQKTWSVLNTYSGSWPISVYDSNSITWNDTTGTFANSSSFNYQLSITPNNMLGNITNGCWGVSSGKILCYKIYKTEQDMKNDSVGHNRYYINQNTYNTWKNTSNDYSINTDNSNNATYTNVVDYNQRYYDEHNTYPSDSTVTIYIEQVPAPTPTPTPTPGGGGGSGSTTVSSNGVNVYINNNPTAQNTNNNTYTDNSVTNNHFDFGGLLSGNGIGSGTVSGNGTGGSGNFFNWLGELGQVLGNLIKNLGEALLHIIEGITDLIQSIIEGLPTMFFDFLGAIFGWLPDEWVSLMSLSLVCMLIFGIVKIFRG